jgi:uncharacterized membrane protein YkoI
MARMKSATCVLFSLTLLLFTTAFAQDSERPVRMRNLPKPVLETVREQSKGATILGLSKEIDNGLTLYEVELKIGGHTRDVLIDSTGAVVEIEEEVALSSLPSAVKAQMEKKAGRGRIIKVESVTKNNVVVAYEAHIKTGRKVSEVSVAPDGQLITPLK